MITKYDKINLTEARLGFIEKAARLAAEITMKGTAYGITAEFDVSYGSTKFQVTADDYNQDALATRHPDADWYDAVQAATKRAHALIDEAKQAKAEAEGGAQ